MAIVYVALGANLGDPLQQAENAIAAIEQIPQTSVIKISPFYRSKPLGPQDQPDYLNAVIKIISELSPLALLKALQTIELNLGRVRKANRWGPRTLDLDILLYDNQVIQSEELTIPHYDMYNREFVLYPLFDIAPDLILPNQVPLKILINKVPINNMTFW
ncbi:2-amino-4-hydroxy-6-hydroxymethyldihydropteridine diphosphokinase [Frischella perrara]|uniref:2-amino-4-hydroxy-6-hydroxymethyldihydropteridine pyrophosphokinase n=1 Tax=Frischella perrara TaxID=1267021 RepID=A0A0A7S2K7_FRIPE|nr:2-amino-4-hydroxy-6-hydroxymethyldihydropteridine diphosphokinase [Frischella perrara]AJA45775.1 2-amino-4-hydroxy-6-hydroxymethyldihydropteridine diphosphokinase [Frischella perrara]MCT6876233.1 2-amino-4-hydroxy-6-hydroxymethyldihydropteridine diphosphokinase [Frischella perrara]PWV60273.1 2-amino-4-hydroxy-6-hydroxymethyldihydropteridine diphosphokinase [Frischella perrara]